jgi:hypothetical protein
LNTALESNITMPRLDFLCQKLIIMAFTAMPAQWRRLVASKVLALNMLYWAMRSALHQHIVIAIKWPTTEVNLFVAAAFFI